MKYRYLGRSGLLVSRLCLGTMTFGMKNWGCDRQTSSAIIRRFVEAGGNFLDTADMYSSGLSEEIVGKALQDYDRDDLVVATKCWFRMKDSPNAKGSSRKHLCEALEASLRRLGTDYVDLFQLHGPDPFTPLEETMATLDVLVRSGKVRYVGCSNFFAWQIVKANGIARELGGTRLISGQHLYNLLKRDIEVEILPACADQGMGMMCWSPLASGMLTGKYKQTQDPPKECRVGMRPDIDVPRYWNDASFRVIDAVVAAAKETDRTPAQVALAWPLCDRRVNSVIVGARTLEQLDANLVVGDWDLPAELCRRIESVAPPAIGYPREWIELSWGNIAGREEFAPWHSR